MYRSSFKKRKGSLPSISVLYDNDLFRVGMILSVIILGIAYVVQMNLSATKGYDIRELEQQRISLQNQADDLELKAMELESIHRVMAQLPEYRLVQANPDAFITTAATTFAAR